MVRWKSKIYTGKKMYIAKEDLPFIIETLASAHAKLQVVPGETKGPFNTMRKIEKLIELLAEDMAKDFENDKTAGVVPAE